MLATVHMKNNVIVRSNREYDYFGNVLEYEYDYFASYSSTSTQNILVLEYTSTITPSLLSTQLSPDYSAVLRCVLCLYVT